MYTPNSLSTSSRSQDAPKCSEKDEQQQQQQQEEPSAHSNMSLEFEPPMASMKQHHQGSSTATPPQQQGASENHSRGKPSSGGVRPSRDFSPPRGDSHHPPLQHGSSQSSGRHYHHQQQHRRRDSNDEPPPFMRPPPNDDEVFRRRRPSPSDENDGRHRYHHRDHRGYPPGRSQGQSDQQQYPPFPMGSSPLDHRQDYGRHGHHHHRHGDDYHRRPPTIALAAELDLAAKEGDDEDESLVLDNPFEPPKRGESGSKQQQQRQTPVRQNTGSLRGSPEDASKEKRGGGSGGEATSAEVGGGNRRTPGSDSSRRHKSFNPSPYSPSRQDRRPPPPGGRYYPPSSSHNYHFSPYDPHRGGSSQRYPGDEQHRQPPPYHTGAPPPPPYYGHHGQGGYYNTHPPTPGQLWPSQSPCHTEQSQQQQPQQQQQPPRSPSPSKSANSTTTPVSKRSWEQSSLRSSGDKRSATPPTPPPPSSDDDKTRSKDAMAARTLLTVSSPYRTTPLPNIEINTDSSSLKKLKRSPPPFMDTPTPSQHGNDFYSSAFAHMEIDTPMNNDRSSHHLPFSPSPYKIDRAGSFANAFDDANQLLTNSLSSDEGAPLPLIEPPSEQQRNGKTGYPTSTEKSSGGTPFAISQRRSSSPGNDPHSPFTKFFQSDSLLQMDPTSPYPAEPERTPLRRSMTPPSTRRGGDDLFTEHAGNRLAASPPSSYERHPSSSPAGIGTNGPLKASPVSLQSATATSRSTLNSARKRFRESRTSVNESVSVSPSPFRLQIGNVGMKQTETRKGLQGINNVLRKGGGSLSSSNTGALAPSHRHNAFPSPPPPPPPSHRYPYNMGYEYGDENHPHHPPPGYPGGSKYNYGTPYNSTDPMAITPSMPPSSSSSAGYYSGGGFHMPMTRRYPPLPPHHHHPGHMINPHIVLTPSSKPNKENDPPSSIAGKKPTRRAPCNCKRSKCLKLYCECFAAEQYCEGCNCHDCSNIPSFEAVRIEAIKATRAKNPNAFKPRFAAKSQRFGANSASSSTSMHAPGVPPVYASPPSDVVITGGHNMGCRCKKSACLKKYCECFEAGVMCGDKCKCVDCLNFIGSQALIDRRRKIKDHRGAEMAMRTADEAWKSGRLTDPYKRRSAAATPAAPTTAPSGYRGSSSSSRGGFHHMPYPPPPSFASSRSEMGMRPPQPSSSMPPHRAQQPPQQQQTPSISSSTLKPTPTRLNFDTKSSKKARKIRPGETEPTLPVFGPKAPEQPKTTALAIFSFLSNDDLYNACLVSKMWTGLSLDEELWQFS